MSYAQFFEETAAVVEVLSEYMRQFSDSLENLSDPEPPDFEEQFTAIWQAVELLQRATQVLAPLIALDVSKSFLKMNDPFKKVSDIDFEGDE